MDKFIIRIPRKQESPLRKQQTAKPLRQMTIEDLRGVIVLEDIERAKVTLLRSDTSTEHKLETLKTLSTKTPTNAILASTGIGAAVSSLCHHADPVIACEAARVASLWKDHNQKKACRVSIEVRCDARTQKLRDSARNLLQLALKSTMKAQVDEYCPRLSKKQKSRKNNTMNCDEDIISKIDESLISDVGCIVSATSLGHSKGVRIDLDSYKSMMKSLEAGDVDEDSEDSSSEIPQTVIDAALHNIKKQCETIDKKNKQKSFKAENIGKQYTSVETQKHTPHSNGSELRSKNKQYSTKESHHGSKDRPGSNKENLQICEDSTNHHGHGDQHHNSNNKHSSKDMHHNNEDKHYSGKDKHHSSNDKHQSSNDKHQSSNDKHHSSKHKHSNKDKHQSSNDKHHSSNHKHSSKDKHQSSKEKHQSSKHKHSNKEKHHDSKHRDCSSKDKRHSSKDEHCTSKDKQCSSSNKHERSKDKNHRSKDQHHGTSREIRQKKDIPLNPQSIELVKLKSSEIPEEITENIKEATNKHAVKLILTDESEEFLGEKTEYISEETTGKLIGVSERLWVESKALISGSESNAGSNITDEGYSGSSDSQASRDATELHVRKQIEACQLTMRYNSMEAPNLMDIDDRAEDTGKLHVSQHDFTCHKKRKWEEESRHISVEEKRIKLESLQTTTDYKDSEMQASRQYKINENTKQSDNGTLCNFILKKECAEERQTNECNESLQTKQRLESVNYLHADYNNADVTRNVSATKVICENSDESNEMTADCNEENCVNKATESLPSLSTERDISVKQEQSSVVGVSRIVSFGKYQEQLSKPSGHVEGDKESSVEKIYDKTIESLKENRVSADKKSRLKDFVVEKNIYSGTYEFDAIKNTSESINILKEIQVEVKSKAVIVRSDSTDINSLICMNGDEGSCSLGTYKNQNKSDHDHTHKKEKHEKSLSRRKTAEEVSIKKLSNSIKSSQNALAMSNESKASQEKGSHTEESVHRHPKHKSNESRKKDYTSNKSPIDDSSSTEDECNSRTAEDTLKKDNSSKTEAGAQNQKESCKSRASERRKSSNMKSLSSNKKAKDYLTSEVGIIYGKSDGQTKKHVTDVNLKYNSPRRSDENKNERSKDHKKETIVEDGKEKELISACKVDDAQIALICEALERELFYGTKRLVSKQYKRTVRKLVFTLKHKEKIRSKVLKGKYDIQKLVRKYMEEEY